MTLNKGFWVKLAVGVLYIAVFFWAATTGKGFLLFIDKQDANGAYPFTVRLDKASLVSVPGGVVKSVYIKGAGQHHLVVLRNNVVTFEGTLDYPQKTKAAVLSRAMINEAIFAKLTKINLKPVAETVYEEPEPSSE